MHPLSDVDIAGLARAYLAASYRWEADGTWHPLRIGAPAPELEARFPAADGFGFVSAWNPHSVPRTDAQNRVADEALQSVLEATGLPFRPGFSAAANRIWREPSWVAAGMPLRQLDRIGRRFEQLATLGWLRGEPVRLRMYARQPAGMPPLDFVDWLE